MIRVAFTADTHADENHRLAEHDRVMAFISRDARERGCELMLHAGDWYERAKTTEVERASVADFVRDVTDQMPLVTVAGNHDSPIEVEWIGRLRTKNAIHAFVRPETIAINGALVACLPWPRKSNLLAAIGTPVSHAESGAIAQECLRNVIRGLGRELDGWDGPRILLAHAMVDGAETDHSQPIVGADMATSLADLALAKADFYGLGHVHAGQSWDIAGAPCVYPSAPRHCNFGEPGQKGYVVVDFDDSVCGCEQGFKRGSCSMCSNRGRVDWEHIPTPCAGMELFEAAWTGAGGELIITSKEFPHPERVRGSECRLRVTVDADQRDAARAAAGELRDRMLVDGAARVKIEEVVRPMLRARAPEVAKAGTLEDQLAAMWATKRPTLGADRRARLLSKLGEVRA